MATAFVFIHNLPFYYIAYVSPTASDTAKTIVPAQQTKSQYKGKFPILP